MRSVHRWSGRGAVMLCGLVCCLVCCLICAACARVGTVTARPAGPAGPATIAREQVFSGVGARIQPVTGDPVVTVSATRARAELAGSDLAQTMIGTRGPDELPLVYYENQFGTEHPNGDVTPSVPRQLAWLAEYRYRTSGGSRPINAPPNRRLWTCTAYIAVGATSAKILDAFDWCH